MLLIEDLKHFQFRVEILYNIYVVLVRFRWLSMITFHDFFLAIHQAKSFCTRIIVSHHSWYQTAGLSNIG